MNRNVFNVNFTMIDMAKFLSFIPDKNLVPLQMDNHQTDLSFIL